MANATLTLERTEGTGADCCVWELAGNAAAIRLRLEVVERLEREALESLRALTKRGSEVGGLLLGRVSRDCHAITIEEYEAVACDYSRGPLYQLSEADELRLEAALARPRAPLSVVGFFRSNTRKDLVPDSNDLALIEKHFSGRDPLVLLVKPFSMKPSHGAWFLSQEGYASPAIEFTFRRGALEQDHPAAQRTPTPAPPAEPPKDPVVPDLRRLDQAMVSPRPAPRRRRWLWLPLLAGLTGASWYLGYRVSGPGLPVPAVASEALALRVERSAGQLRLSWNRAAPAIATAQKATLSIVDGTQEQNLNLDLGQLRTGSLVYTPTTGDVAFRLEVTDLQHGKTVTESIRAVAGRPSALGPPPLRLPEQAPPIIAAPEPRPEAQAPADTPQPDPAEPDPSLPAPTGTAAPPK
ncbi:MAG: hypothetical protein ABSH05_27280 [Bryobacteraceae bacterium]|jgi:hypothetical protein